MTAGHSKPQSVIDDAFQHLLKVNCHAAVGPTMHCKQALLIVRQLQYIVACVGLQEGTINV